MMKHDDTREFRRLIIKLQVCATIIGVVNVVMFFYGDRNISLLLWGGLTFLSFPIAIVIAYILHREEFKSWRDYISQLFGGKSK